MSRSINIQILSDLHLETPLLRPRYDTFDLPVAAPHLALLGDIGKANQPGLFRFLRKQLQRYETVFYLLGNHEAYRDTDEYSSFSRARELLEVFQTEVNDDTQSAKPGTKYGRFVFLERTRFDFPGTNITILGCTLFSQIEEHQQDSVTLKINDFSAFGPGSGAIDDWDTAAHTRAHRDDLEWLNRAVEEIEHESPGREIAIFTHHSPTRSRAANDPKHLEDERQVGSAFVTDLSEEACWNSPVVKLWAFGHTHYNCDFMAARTHCFRQSETGRMRVLANQLGYFRADVAPGFDDEKVVNLGPGLFAGITLESDAYLRDQGESSDRGGRSE